MEVIEAATTSGLKRLQNVLSNVTYSPSNRQAGDLIINNQLTLNTARICVKMFHCSVIW